MHESVLVYAFHVGKLRHDKVLHQVGIFQNFYVKLLKEAGLLTKTFNIYPPNRVDFVYTYACVHGPGGSRNNKKLSLEQMAYACKGIASAARRFVTEDTARTIKLLAQLVAGAYQETAARSRRAGIGPCSMVSRTCSRPSLVSHRAYRSRRAGIGPCSMASRTCSRPSLV